MRSIKPRSLAFITFATVILLVAALLRLLPAYPLGPHYDEAVNLLVSRSIAFGGLRPFPMLEAYQGREVLYFYLNAPLLTLIQDSMFPFHLTNAFSNLITVAASMALGRLMFRGSRGVIVGLAMGVGMAIAFPQVWLARQAFRAVTLPLMQALTLIFLWRGLRGTRRYGWLIAAGICGGLALYTYNSSRLFPFWLALGGLALLIADRRHFRQRVRQGTVFFIALLIVALPMIVYALQRPDIFFNRLAEVTQAEQSISLIDSIVLHARMFFIEGDPYLRYNIPGRPYLTLPEGLLMLLGIGIAAGRLVRPGNTLEKAAYTLALLSPLMVIPSVISVGGLPPSHMRSLGMIPLIFVLVGLGYEQVVSSASRLLMRQNLVGLTRYLRVGFIGVVAWLLVGGFLVERAYFAWASLPAVFYETDSDLARAAEWARTVQRPGDILYVAAKDRPYPTFQIAGLPDVTYIGTDSFFFPPPGLTGIAIFPRSAPPPDEWREWLLRAEPNYLSAATANPEPFEWYFLNADRIPNDLTLPNADARNPFVSSLGVQLADIARSGASVALSTVWHIDAAPTANDFTPIAQLEDANGVVIARVMPYITETDRWRVGETYAQRVTLDIPIGTPMGEHALNVAWVARSTDVYQPYLNGAIWAQVGVLTVERADQTFDATTLTPHTRLDQDVAAGTRLIGYDALPDVIRPGEAFLLGTYWQALALDDGENRPDTYRLTLGDVILYDGEWDYGRDAWRDGDLYTLRTSYRVPRDQPAGIFTLSLQVDTTLVTLGEFTVAGVARQFEAPAVDHTVDVVFGEVIRLHGYSARTTAAGIAIDLAWQSLDEIDADYTVFVHLIDANGQIIDQRDAMPQANTYPTTLWQNGEFVLDQYLFPIQAFSSVKVGIYQPQTGQRLSAVFDNRPSIDRSYVFTMIE